MTAALHRELAEVYRRHGNAEMALSHLQVATSIDCMNGEHVWIGRHGSRTRQCAHCQALDSIPTTAASGDSPP